MTTQYTITRAMFHCHRDSLAKAFDLALHGVPGTSFTRGALTPVQQAVLSAYGQAERRAALQDSEEYEAAIAARYPAYDMSCESPYLPHADTWEVRREWPEEWRWGDESWKR